MNDGILLGQYIPGTSPVHKLDSRVKLILTIFYMVSLFFVDNFLGFGVYSLAILFIMSVAKIPFLRVLKGLKPIIFLLIVAGLINVFTQPGKVIFTIGPLKATEEGFINAFFIDIRIILLVIGSTILSLTTDPLAMTDGLEAIMSPLKVIKFPSNEIAMMISIALRFIPTLFEEANKIVKAQKARGADFDSGSFMDRAKAMVPLLVPLFLNSIERADELGIAMEARCYRGGSGRTRLNPLKLHLFDVVVLFLSMAIMICISIFL